MTAVIRRLSDPGVSQIGRLGARKCHKWVQVVTDNCQNKICMEMMVVFRCLSNPGVSQIGRFEAQEEPQMGAGHHRQLPK